MRYAFIILALLAAVFALMFYEPTPKNAYADKLTAPEMQSKFDEISTDQAKNRNTGYIQVLRNGSYPQNEGRRMGITVPPGWAIDIYEGPKGKGYEIVYDDGTSIIHKGYGPEAAERTYTVNKASFFK